MTKDSFYISLRIDLNALDMVGFGESSKQH